MLQNVVKSLYCSFTSVLFLPRCLPMNLTAEDLASGVLRDRVKVGASLADVDPMNLDSSVSRNTNKHQKAVKQQLLLFRNFECYKCLFSPQVRFDSVGGLSTHIQSLKEMVVFPLLYPEIFERFKIQPPR